MEVSGLGLTQPVLVDSEWIKDLVARASTEGPEEILLTVDRSTGALIDQEQEFETDTYRPTARIIEYVKARDGRCRFPGCSVNARFVDLDHVRSWPRGPTGAQNLIGLCRRHHRIKQLLGWQVSLHPDGSVVWIDPVGRRFVTDAVDHRPMLTPGAGVPSFSPRAANDDVRTTHHVIRTANDDVRTTHHVIRTANDDVRTANDDVRTTNRVVRATNVVVRATNEDDDDARAWAGDDAFSAAEHALEHLVARTPLRRQREADVEIAAVLRCRRRSGSRRVQRDQSHPRARITLTFDHTGGDSLALHEAPPF